MSESSKQFSAFLRGETDQPAPDREKSDSEKFSDLIRATAAADNAAADAMNDWFARRIGAAEKNREGSEGGEA